ncbi:MAG: hypothetical protein AMXMBFR64_41360 [Myxococcales bacterium]
MGRWVWALALVALAGCRAEEGVECALDTDCEGGLLCHPFTKICTAPLCDSKGVCSLPDPDAGADVGADAGPSDTGPADTGPAGKDTGQPIDAPVGDTGPVSCDMPATFAGTSWRVTKFQIAPDGKKGNGLDVDGSAATCAPPLECEAGIDNAFGKVGGLANGFLEQSIDDGTTVLVVHVTPEGPGRAVWTLDCEDAGGTIRALPLTWGDCGPKGAIPGATFDGKSLGAGDGGTFIIPLALLGSVLRVPLADVEVSGTVDGKLSLVLAGALKQADLNAAIDSIPKETFGGLTHQQVKDLVANNYTVDLDMDGDGTKESISASFLVEGTPVTVVGP